MTDLVKFGFGVSKDENWLDNPPVLATITKPREDLVSMLREMADSLEARQDVGSVGIVLTPAKIWWAAWSTDFGNTVK